MGGPDGWFARVTRELEGLPAERFTEVMGIGPTVAASVAAWFAAPGTAGVLQDLVDAGVEPTRPAPVIRGPEADLGPLAGKTLVVTGTLPGFDRQGAEDAIRACRRQGVGLGQPQDLVPGGGRERWLQAGQGPGAGRARSSMRTPSASCSRASSPA